MPWAMNVEREGRSGAIEGLRHLADLFEANPQLPVPHYMAWTNGADGVQTEAERFNQLHDLADVLGAVPVMENPESGERTLKVDFGALTLHARAAADPREPAAPPEPRPASRPVPAEQER